MNDAFARLTAPVVQAVLDVQRRAARGESPPLDEVRMGLTGALDEADRKVESARELASDWALARRALVYWIDEILINSSWIHAPEWREHILEWESYRERLGGEKFFDLARDAEARTGTDPLEIFLLCAALGFQGKLASQSAELTKWAQRAYARIASASPQPDRFMPDDSDEPEPLRPLPGPTRLLRASVLVAATALVTLVAFLVAAHLTG
jgi:type VI secretion system protein ImpK